MATMSMCYIATSDGGLVGTESLKAMRNLVLEGGQFLVDPGLSMLAWVLVVVFPLTLIRTHTCLFAYCNYFFYLISPFLFTLQSTSVSPPSPLHVPSPLWTPFIPLPVHSSAPIQKGAGLPWT